MEYESGWNYLIIAIGCTMYLCYFIDQKKRYLYMPIGLLTLFVISMLAKSDIITGLSLLITAACEIYDSYKDQKENGYSLFSFRYNLNNALRGYIIAFLLIFIGINLIFQ